MSEIQVFQVDLDEEVLSHLAIAESVEEFRNEALNIDLILDTFVREVYEWQLDHLRKHKRPATASVLAEQFDIDLVTPETAAGDLIGRLRERYMRNNARQKMELIAETYAEDPAAVPNLLVRTGRELQGIVNQKGEVYGTGDFDRAMARYDKTLLQGPGPSFGFKDVDDHLHGQRGLTFLLAPPKTWKSWTGVNVLTTNTLNGLNVDLYSLELPADETDMRVRCMVAGIPYWKYVRGSLSREDRDILEQASGYLDDLGTYRVIKPPSGERSVDHLIENSRDHGADLILIDQLQYLENAKGKQLGSCDPGEYWPSINALRDYSDDGPIFVIHQFNRSAMNADKMPEPQQAKASSAVEETATLVLGLWANKDMRKSHVMEMGILASRNYNFKSWEIGVELTRGCELNCYGEFNHEPEED